MDMKMEYMEKSCLRYGEILSSSAPAPGGGSVSGLIAAMGASLGSMVINLTIGNKNNNEKNKELKRLLESCENLRLEFFRLAEKDIESFGPLSKAYSMPKDTEEEKEKRSAFMEEALKEAGETPMILAKTTCELIDVLEELLDKGTKNAISDVGVGATFANSALESSQLNVLINTKYMKDREYAGKLNNEINQITNKYLPKCQIILERVKSYLKEQV